MFKFDNTHIFTGYLKQLLSAVNIPTCKIYTEEFANYRARHGKEDPRVIESIDTVFYGDSQKRLATRVNYLKNNELYNYFWNYADNLPNLGHDKAYWRRVSDLYYCSEKAIPGLTKRLNSPGGLYDTPTHEYLGEYLRFLRDYHSVNLMSLYNCFTNKICNNIYLNFNIKSEYNKTKKVTFDSQDAKYKIYILPVKLFADYTVAIDSNQGVEMFCGLYNTGLDASEKSIELITKTYQRVNKSLFNQPILYDKLNVKYWSYERELIKTGTNGGQEKQQLNTACISRWDIANREQDLKLFIKVPVFCRSSIVVLEGDYRHFNDSSFKPDSSSTSNNTSGWEYQQNCCALNFSDELDINAGNFKPISKLQLLEFNTGESYPFADRLIEYLSGSAITPIDSIPDNIKRAQRVMKQNKNYFKIEGLWENKMQKIIYDYILNAGPVEVADNNKLNDKRCGYHYRLGHTNKSTLYDTLGYIDRDAEKWYASWTKKDNKPMIIDNIHSVDIYVDKNGKSLWDV